MPDLRRVMCVEDDPDIRLILDFSLQRLGHYEVCLCASGQEALDHVIDFAPQLILLDVMMPGLTGPQTLKQLQGLPAMQGVPVVFLTAKAMQEEVEGLLALGASGVIVKPFDPMTLPQDIRRYRNHGHTPSN